METPTILLRLTNWYFTRRTLSYWLILALDVLVVWLSGLAVYTAVTGPWYLVRHLTSVMGAFAAYLIIYVVMFRLFRTYSGVLRYASFYDLLRLGCAMVLGTGLVFALRNVMPLDQWLFPIAGRTLLTAALVATLLMWVTRIVVKYAYDEYCHHIRAQRAMVYGTKSGGVSLAKGLAAQAGAEYVLRGFLSDDPKMRGKFVMGKRVYIKGPETVTMLKRMSVTTLFVSPLKYERLREDKAFVHDLLTAKINILVLPHSVTWDGHSDLSAVSLKPIDLEDILPREQIQVNMDEIGRQLSQKVIMITGAAGSIGSEIVRQVAAFKPRKLVLIDQAETPMHDMRMLARQWPDIETLTIVTSITKTRQMEKLFRDHRPEYVFHAAAYKHVPMMEDNPGNCVQNNCHGTRVIADLAVKYGVRKFVMVSTDKAVRPTNVMGASKRICEIYVQSLNRAIEQGRVEGRTQFVTTRFGNVLGSNGSVIPIFNDQIRNGGPVCVTHPDIVRFFMLISEACRLVLEAGTMGHGGEIFVFDMGAPVRIADLAQRMIDLSGARDIEIKYTGLRPGEKLYEEVLSDEESTKPTPHPKIRVAAVREYDYAEACRHEDELLALSYSYDDMAIVSKMKQIVPEFRSQHSVYEALDEKR